MSDTFSSESTSGLSVAQLFPDAARKSLPRMAPRLKARARLVRRRMRPSGDDSISDRLNAIDPSFVEDGAEDISVSDVETVVDEADAIEDRFRDNGPLRRLLADGRLLIELVRDAWDGQYRQVPWWTVSGATFALLYVLNPLDLVPDALPVIGLLDDATVVSACLVLIEQDLADYRQWLAQSDRAVDEEPDSQDLISG